MKNELLIILMESLENRLSQLTDSISANKKKHELIEEITSILKTLNAVKKGAIA